MITSILNNKIYNSFAPSFGSNTYRCDRKLPLPCESDVYIARQERKASKNASYIERQAAKLERSQPIKTIDHKNKVMDILAKGEYPTNVLSNYHREEIPFVVDGIPCHSVEGILQGIKQSDIQMQNDMCKKSGSKAKYLGKTFLWGWQCEQKLHWQGETFKRNSKEYKNFLEKIFTARFEQCPDFKKALEASKDYTLKHSCGTDDTTRTVLTNKEFIGILNKLRKML